MNIKSPLKKIFTVLLWCLLGGTGLAILIAAINAKNSSLCQGTGNRNQWRWQSNVSE